MKKWNYFYEKIRDELLQIDSDFNTSYLSILQENNLLLEDCVLRSNLANYKAIYLNSNLQGFNKMVFLPFHFNFDWCSIKQEVYYSTRKEPSTFDSFISDLYYLFDFLLSYNSLIECPTYKDNELYYRKFNGEVIYECKFPPMLYDLTFNVITTFISIDYCEREILEEKGFYRV